MPALDGVRGIAILLVLAYHFMGYQTQRGVLFRAFFGFNRSGWIGVDLFFVLSGFLITGILLDARGTKNFFLNFYMRRTLRIFPLYYLTLAIVFGLPLLIPAMRTAGFLAVEPHQGWLWLYGANIYNAIMGRPSLVGGWVELNHLWSLAVEEQFYLVWAPLVFLIGLRRLPVVCFACIVGALLLRLAMLSRGSSATAVYMLTPCRIDALAAGALVAALIRMAPRQLLIRISIGVLLVCSVFVLAIALRLGEISQEAKIVQTWGFSALALGFASAIVLIVTRPVGHPLAVALSFAPLRSIGKYSYAIYVLHWALAPSLFAHLLPMEWFFAHLHYVPGLLARFVLIVSVCYLMAQISWRLIEQPFLSMKRFFSYRSAPTALADAASPAAGNTPDSAKLPGALAV